MNSVCAFQRLYYLFLYGTICWDSLVRDEGEDAFQNSLSAKQLGGKLAKTDHPSAPGRPPRITLCGHILNLDCLEKLLTSVKTCPGCGKPIDKKTHLKEDTILPQPETPPLSRKSSLVVNSSILISGGSPEKILDAQMNLEKAKMEIAELKRQLEAETEKVVEAERKRAELQIKHDQFVTDNDNNHRIQSAKVIQLEKQLESSQVEFDKLQDNLMGIQAILKKLEKAI